MKQAAPFRISAGLFALLLAGGFLAAPHSQAIPNQINLGGFFNRAGMRFEDFAAMPETWLPASPLKGRWEPSQPVAAKSPSVERLRLTDSATLFGLPAEEVTVERVDGRTTRFDARFVPPSGVSLSQWERTLKTNLAAWSDGAAEARFWRGAAVVVVTARPYSGDVAVTFTRREDSPGTTP